MPERLVSLHFKQRVAERIGPDVDALDVALHVVRGIEADDGTVRFKARCDRACKIYRFEWLGVTYFAVVNVVTMTLVTLLPADGWVRRKTKRVRLRPSVHSVD